MSISSNNVLLTWDSYNHGLGVTLGTILQLYTNHKVSIGEIIYLQNQDLQAITLSELALVKGKSDYSSVKRKFPEHASRIQKINRICDELKTHQLNYTITQKRLHIKSVVDYQSIYDEVRRLLKSMHIEYTKSNKKMYVNISAGTPQMSTVWLMLNTSGYFPKNTELLSSQWNKKEQKQYIKYLKFKPKFYLSELLEQNNVEASADVVINPNDTKSDTLKAIEDKLYLFAGISTMPILLLGERGVGKSTYVKQFIHQQLYAKLPFIPLACGTFDKNLLRSELFGYTKGAFTGANNDKSGLLKKLEGGGILFLDEVQDLSKELQRQLMQVLQNKIYYPIGSTKAYKSDFRLITASNLNYQQLQQKLHPDFFDRIATFIVEIPPLRKCPKDLESRWKKTWELVIQNKKYIKPIWNKKIEAYLKSKPLMGNFRSLQKLVAHFKVFLIGGYNDTIAWKKSVEEYEKWQDKLLTNNYLLSDYFEKDMSYNDMVAAFNYEIAKEAIRIYGSKKEASEVLNRSISMLNKDLRKFRLSK